MSPLDARSEIAAIALRAERGVIVVAVRRGDRVDALPRCMTPTVRA